ncbi:MAG: hypothetical protein ACRC62_25210 [Microcoleus sp.]
MSERLSVTYYTKSGEENPLTLTRSLRVHRHKQFPLLASIIERHTLPHEDKLARGLVI